MDFLDAIILGIVEGLTEFLPVSSTGHLTITEKLLGLSIDDPAVTAFTVVIQMGAIFAVILYFRKDVVNITAARARLEPLRSVRTWTSAPPWPSDSPWMR